MANLNLQKKSKFIYEECWSSALELVYDMNMNIKIRKKF